MNILLLEDDSNLSSYLRMKLEALHNFVSVCESIHQAAARIEAERFDAYVIDRLLPDGDGETWLQRRREMGDLTPAVLLTALGSLADKVSGLRFGDDYMVKPFEFDELWARLQSLARRASSDAHAQSAPQAVIGALTIDRLTHKVTRGEQVISLKPMEYRLLDFLVIHAPQTVTRKMLLENVWGFNFDPSTNIVETYVSRLRAKLDVAGTPSLIQTVRGEGYRIGS